MRAIVRGSRKVCRNKARFMLVMIVLVLCAGITITIARESLSIRDN